MVQVLEEVEAVGLLADKHLFGRPGGRDLVGRSSIATAVGSVPAIFFRLEDRKKSDDLHAQGTRVDHQGDRSSPVEDIVAIPVLAVEEQCDLLDTPLEVVEAPLVELAEEKVTVRVEQTIGELVLVRGLVRRW